MFMFTCTCASDVFITSYACMLKKVKLWNLMICTSLANEVWGWRSSSSHSKIKKRRNRRSRRRGRRKRIPPSLPSLFPPPGKETLSNCYFGNLWFVIKIVTLFVVNSYLQLDDTGGITH